MIYARELKYDEVQAELASLELSPLGSEFRTTVDGVVPKRVIVRDRIIARNYGDAFDLAGFEHTVALLPTLEDAQELVSTADYLPVLAEEP